MSAVVTSLWPEDIKVDVLTPLAILRYQAAELSRITNGVLEADVVTTTGQDDFVVHRLEIVAPQLGGQRHGILTATHRTSLYPVVIEAELYRPTKVSAQSVRNLAVQGIAVAMGVDTRTEYLLRDWPPVDDWRPVASNQSDFLKRVGEVLRSPSVRAAIDSMLALINEKNQPTSTETAA